MIILKVTKKYTKTTSFLLVYLYGYRISLFIVTGISHITENEELNGMLTMPQFLSTMRIKCLKSFLANDAIHTARIPYTPTCTVYNTIIYTKFQCHFF